MLRTAAFAFSLISLAPLAHAETSRLDQPLPAFDRLEVSAPFDVVWKSGAPSIKAEGDADLLARLSFESRDGLLRLSAKSGAGSWGFNKKLHILISSPALSEARLQGSGDLELRALTAPAFAMALSGSGDLRAKAIKVQRLQIKLAGSGDLVVEGETDVLAASLAGSGDMVLKNLVAHEATLALAGSGDLSAHASQKASVSCSGSGDIDVFGAPAQRDVARQGSCDVSFRN
jgi:hypothetical protein